MAGTFFYLKLILAISLLFALIRESIKEKGLVKVPFFVFVCVVCAASMRNLIVGSIPKEAYSQATLLTFLILVAYDVFKKNEGQTDYKQIFNSVILDHSDYLMAIVRYDDLEMVASNKAFKMTFENAKHHIDITSLVSRLHRGLTKIEIVDHKNNRRIYSVKMDHLSSRFSMLTLKEITNVESLKATFQELETMTMNQWQNAPNLMMVRTFDDIILYMNPMYETFLEYPLSRFKGQVFKAIYMDLDEYYTHEAAKEQLQNNPEQTVKLSLRYSAPSGQIKFYDVAESVSLFEGRQVIVTNGVDQTVKKHMALMTQSYEAFQEDEVDLSATFVLDFIKKEILFLERVNRYLEMPLKDYAHFISQLSVEDQSKLNKVFLASMSFSPFIIEIGHGSYYLINRIFSDDNGYALGALVKFVSANVPLHSIKDMDHMVLEYVREGVIVVNYDGKIEYCNDYITKLLKYSRGELLSFNITEITKGLTLAMIQRNWTMSREHKILQFERVYVTSEGEEVGIDVFSVLMQTRSSEKLVLLLTPSSEKKASLKLQKTLLEPTLRYSHIFEALEHQMVEIKFPNKDVFFYESFTEDKGFVGLELKFLQWLNNVHDDDRARVFESIDNIVYGKLKSLIFEYRYFTQGEWQWVRSNGKYIENLTHASVVLLNQNVDEMKNTTERIAESKHILQESERIANIAHWKYDVSKNEFYVSHSFPEVMNTAIEARILHYEQFMEYLLWTDRAYFESEFYKFIWRNQPLDVVVRTQPASNVEFYNFKGQVYYEKEETPAYAIGVIHNITEDVKQKNENILLAQNYEEIVEQAPYPMALVIRGGFIKITNAAFRNLISPLGDDIKDFTSFKNEWFKRIELKEAHVDQMLELSSVFKAVEVVGEGVSFTVSLSPLLSNENRYYGNLMVFVEHGIESKAK